MDFPKKTAQAQKLLKFTRLFWPYRGKLRLHSKQAVRDEFSKSNTEVKIMARNSSNRANVPEAKEWLNQMKYEIANEQGVNLKEGYNGDLTAKENGTVGGYMVKRMIEQYQGK